MPLDRKSHNTTVNVRLSHSNSCNMRDGRNCSSLIEYIGQSTEIGHEQCRCIKFRCVSYTPYNFACYNFGFRSQWPRVLRRGTAAIRLLGLRVRIRSGAWESASCVLSCRGICVGLITGPEEPYRVLCVWVRSWSLDNEAPAH